MKNALNDYLHIEDNVMTILGSVTLNRKITVTLLKIMPNVLTIRRGLS